MPTAEQEAMLDQIRAQGHEALMGAVTSSAPVLIGLFAWLTLRRARQRLAVTLAEAELEELGAGPPLSDPAVNVSTAAAGTGGPTQTTPARRPAQSVPWEYGAEYRSSEYSGTVTRLEGEDVEEDVEG